MGMLEMIQEMAQNQIVIISDSDREFVLGLALLIETGEAVPASYAERVQNIYTSYQQNQYA
jgi:hypothetical protein